MTWVCPVGCCHPATLRPLEVEGPAMLCRRHWGRLSPPLASSLAGARKAAEAGGHEAEDRLRRILVEAIAEARARDEHWVKAYVTWTTDDGAERVEGFERGRDALLRVVALEVEGLRAEAWGGAHGQRVTERLRAGSPWVFEGMTLRGEVFGGGGKTLAAAVRVYEQALRDRELGLRPSTVVWANKLTGEEWSTERVESLHKRTGSDE